MNENTTMDNVNVFHKIEFIVFTILKLRNVLLSWIKSKDVNFMYNQHQHYSIEFIDYA